ncbi:hypothetical protein HJFPF1_08790 [Paramyrothecium foliicola]|nr:hypothetical protein HJFPF1_08790 [Paramyrothecium foliicola]
MAPSHGLSQLVPENPGGAWARRGAEPLLVHAQGVVDSGTTVPTQFLLARNQTKRNGWIRVVARAKDPALGYPISRERGVERHLLPADEENRPVAGQRWVWQHN